MDSHDRWWESAGPPHGGPIRTAGSAAGAPCLCGGVGTLAIDCVALGAHKLHAVLQEAGLRICGVTGSMLRRQSGDTEAVNVASDNEGGHVQVQEPPPAVRSRTTSPATRPAAAGAAAAVGAPLTVATGGGAAGASKSCCSSRMAVRKKRAVASCPKFDKTLRMPSEKPSNANGSP